jgi:hypothetical protein
MFVWSAWDEMANHLTSDAEAQRGKNVSVEMTEDTHNSKTSKKGKASEQVRRRQVANKRYVITACVRDIILSYYR